jgi:choline dehydrogenase
MTDTRSTHDFGTYDYVILGGGTAGCVLANRLSADPTVSVLLLEAGGKDNYPWIHLPIGYLKCIGNPRTDWCYRTEPDAGLNGRAIGYPRGRVLGGSSSINGMLSLRGQARDYDEWAHLTGDTRWSWEQVLPVFRRSERHWAGSNPWHGDRGEWRVARQRVRWPLLDDYVRAAQAAGIPLSTDYNRGNNFGIGAFEVNQRRGLRWNTVKAFLDPARGRPNLRIVTGALIERIVIEERRARGVEFIHAGERHRVSTRHETLLAAGAIGSPAILQRSGVGPAGVLGAHGIPVVAELPGVGANLQDHLQLRMVFKLSGTETLNQWVRSPWRLAAMALQYLVLRRGPLSMAPSQLGGFFHSSAAVETPDLEFHIQPLSLDRFGAPLHEFPAFTASVCHLRPGSRGSVTLRDRDPGSAPIIAPRYLSTPEDRQIAAQAIRLTRQIVDQPVMQKYRPVEYLPGAEIVADEALAVAAGDIGTTIFHPSGTCAMGRANDAQAVTDSELRVRGIAALRVIDTSVMPTITSGNTNTPTIMIAERGAELVTSTRKSGGPLA